MESACGLDVASVWCSASFLWMQTRRVDGSNGEWTGRTASGRCVPDDIYLDQCLFVRQLHGIGTGRGKKMRERDFGKMGISKKAVIVCQKKSIRLVHGRTHGRCTVVRQLQREHIVLIPTHVERTATSERTHR